MRSILCAAALVSLCSAASAERIQIIGVVANYVTARDAVDIEIWLDRPLDIEQEWLAFVGAHSTSESRPAFRIENRTPGVIPTAQPTETFTLLSYRKEQGSRVEVAERAGIVPAIDARDDMHTVAFSFAADELRLHEIFPDPFSGLDTFAYVAMSYTVGGEVQAIVHGTSTINAPGDTAVPEPSSVVLLALGVVCVLCHLVRRPRFRERCVKRHVRGEPITPRAVVRDAEVAAR